MDEEPLVFDDMIPQRFDFYDDDYEDYDIVTCPQTLDYVDDSSDDDDCGDGDDIPNQSAGGIIYSTRKLFNIKNWLDGMDTYASENLRYF